MATIKSYAADGQTRSFTVNSGLKTMTFFLYGGAGGAGGDDAGHSGGSGAPGDLVQVQISVSSGDLVELSVGQGGQRGGNSASNAPGGQGGGSYKTSANVAYSGGAGGRAGGSGSSGGGGGGGGATVLAINGNVIAVAGGGGGGGGSGNHSNGIDASVVFANIGVPAGMNGQIKSGDGGGGGGGGGGYYGGAGGATNDGDNGADPGVHGSSWISNVAPVISGNIILGTGRMAANNAPGYDIGTYSRGGQGTTGGQNSSGGDGFAIVQLEPLPFPYYKSGGTWKLLANAFVMAPSNISLSSRHWYPLKNMFVKVNDKWLPVSAAGNVAFFDRGPGVRWSAGGTRNYL